MRRSMSVNGPRAPSATRWAGAQGPNRDRRDRVGLYQIAIRRNRAPGVEESDDEGVERAIGAHSIFLRVPGLLAITQKARWGAPVRSRTDPPDRPGWRLYRSSCSPGASACRPPSCRAPRAIGRRRGGPASLTHPLGSSKRDQMGILRDALLPERAARIRRDTGEVRDSFGSLGVTRVRSGALAVPIRGPRPAIVPPMGSGSEPRSSRRRSLAWRVGRQTQAVGPQIGAQVISLDFLRARRFGTIRGSANRHPVNSTVERAQKFS